jgi:phosphoribosylaminoimidazolecarboxamide formyltransferase / IMP cyclohydrolase
MNDTIVPIRRALLSVYDKRGLLDLAAALSNQGAELLASGGTYAALEEGGFAVTEVAEYTGQPEVLGGRVKTLHPKIHAGILARRDVPDDLVTLERLGFPSIDLVVVNLYPFEATVARAGATFAEAIENIDIGGPSLIRAAAKNHAHVAVATSPEQYAELIAALRGRGGTSLDERRSLATAAFGQTARYDRAIAAYLERHAAAAQADVTASGSPYPDRLELVFELRQPLRYGENPHQTAALYVEQDPGGPNLATAVLRHGKELSYNNLLDLDSALKLVRALGPKAACILKHNNPCGAAIASDLATAFERAYEGDPLSAFGGVVGLSDRVDLATADRLCQPGRFIEAILAPGFDDDALECLRTKPSWKHSVRLVDLQAPLQASSGAPTGHDYRRIEGGLLAQGWDSLEANTTGGTVATRRAPSDAERRDLDFAWRVCAAVKSNAIVLVKDGQVVGVGAGQMSRLDSVKIAVEKAGGRAAKSVLASDAFFPFRDGPDAAAQAGVAAIIQPGGSKRDAETVAACNEHGMAMVLTGRRHFRH